MTPILQNPVKEKTAASPFNYYRYDSQDNRNFVVPFHYHEDQQIFKVLEGTLTISINSIPHVLNKGDVAILPSNCVHALYPLQSVAKFESLTFNLRELFDLSQFHYKLVKQIVSHQIEVATIFHVDGDKKVTDIVADIIRTYRDGAPGCVLAVTGKILEMLAIAINNGYCTEYPKEDMNRNYKYHLKSSIIYKFICDNFRREVTLEELASAVDLSEKYFCKFFKELTDLRPMEFVNMFRIEAAAIELVISDDSINEIASRCGFKDPCYFTKLFRRFKGSSPRDFRDLVTN